MANGDDRQVARSPRVILVSRLFLPEIGAASFRLGALAQSLHDQGATLRVLTTRPPKRTHAESLVTPYKVSRTPVMRDKSGSVRGYLQYLSFDIPVAIRLLFLRADIVIAEPPPTTGVVVAITSLLRGHRFAYYAADIWSDAAESTNAPRIVVAALRGMERFILKRAHIVLAVSPEVATRVRDLTDKAQVVVVGNGIDTTIFTPTGRGHAVSQPYFAYVGTMSEWQGCQVFIEAIRLLSRSRPDVRLHFIGQGAQEAHLRDLARDLRPGTVTFHGVLEPEDAAAWLRTSVAALVSIVPGQGYDFARPTKIFAAAACGAPVIFAGQGAGSDLVSANGLGWAVRFAASDVSRAMKWALDAREGPTVSSDRDKRAEWARANASLKTVGARAAEAVLSALER